MNKKTPVLLQASRTPFLESAGAYSVLMNYELGAIALNNLLEKVNIDPVHIEQIIMGTVLQEIHTPNIARESMLKADFPSSIPAYTTVMAGISPNIAAMNLCNEIALGRVQLGIAGGTENFSDVPIRLSQNIRRTAMKIHQSKGVRRQIKQLGQLRPRDFMLDIPSSSDFTTQLTMGESCEAMRSLTNISRQQCDEYAMRSHLLAAKAAEQHQTQIDPVYIGKQTINKDNSIRKDTNLSKLSTLKPSFDHTHGIITAGNSSRFTDGAGVMLIGSMGMAENLNLRPMLIFKDYLIAGVDNVNTEHLLGPAMSIPRLLHRNNLCFEDINIWEIHEAFAAQVLINLECMQSKSFIDQRFGNGHPYGNIAMEQLNTRGGSLALGNPFAATGVRLIYTAAQRLRDEKQRYAIVSTCAGGGLGAAILLENPDFV